MEVEELSQAIEKYGKDVYRFCYKISGDLDQADELYQQTFLKATELCQKIDNAQNPKAFFVAISARLWQNQRRKMGWRNRIAKMEMLQEELTNLPQQDETSTPESLVLSKEVHTMIEMALASLNDKLKIPLYMYYSTGLTVEDIASTLGIPIGTIKSRLYKARKMMKNHMEDNGYERF